MSARAFCQSKCATPPPQARSRSSPKRQRRLLWSRLPGAGAKRGRNVQIEPKFMPAYVLAKLRLTYDVYRPINKRKRL